MEGRKRGAMEQTERKSILLRGLDAAALEAFDDLWRASRAPRIKSRCEAIRMLIDRTVATGGAIWVQPNG